jgi:hypothetical protein
MRTWTASSLEPQTILFRTDHRSPLSRTLIFQQKKGLLLEHTCVEDHKLRLNSDMFEFQQKLTGYNIGYDE